MQEVLGSILGLVKLDTVSSIARHRCDVSSELICPDAKSWRWAPATRHTLPRNKGRIMKFFFNFSLANLNGIFSVKQHQALQALSARAFAL